MVGHTFYPVLAEIPIVRLDIDPLTTQMLQKMSEFTDQEKVTRMDEFEAHSRSKPIFDPTLEGEAEAVGQFFRTNVGL